MTATTGGARNATDALSKAAMTRVREVVEASDKPLRHDDVVRKTQFPRELTYLALRRLQDRGEIRAEFLLGERVGTCATYYTAKGNAQ